MPCYAHFTVKAGYFLLVAAKMVNDCSRINGVLIWVLSGWSSSKLVSSPKSHLRFLWFHPSNNIYPLVFLYFNYHLVNLLILWNVKFARVVGQPFLSSTFCTYLDARTFFIWPKVDTMYQLTKLQHLFIHNCLKINDRSAKSYWPILVQWRGMD